MARDYQTKSNVGALPDSISATRLGSGEFNSIAVELENAVTTSDQTLAPADGTGEVTDQLAMALAIYGAGGAFYHADTGAVNAYVLHPISPKVSPPDYFDGFTIIFEPGTPNTTTSTVNVNSMGLKTITYSNGNPLKGGELTGSCGIKYNEADDRFDLLFSSGSLEGLSPFYVADATQADQGAASTNPDSLTIFDIAALVGTTKYATVLLPHNPVAGAQTLYTFDTSLDLTSYPNLYFKFDHGSMIDRTTGDEIFTVYSPRNFLFSEHQVVVTANTIVDFATDTPLYGTVDVFPWISTSYSNVRRPDGFWLDVSSSTTNGLQEAVDYACGDGTATSGNYDLQVWGREDNSTGGAETFNLTTPLQFPAMQGKKIRFNAVTLNFTPALGSTPCMVFDSCMMVDFEMAGSQVVATTTGPLLVFDPQNPVPVDAIESIIASRFVFTAVAQLGAISGDANAVVLFNCDYPILNSTFIFAEINDAPANTTSVDVTVADPTGGGTFSNNIFRCMNLHEAGAVGIYVGQSPAAAGMIIGNHWEASIDGSGIANSRAVNTFGTNDTFYINCESPGFDYAIQLESSAANNLFVSSYLTASVARINNLATDKRSNKIVISNSISPIAITPGASPYAYQNTYAQDMMIAVSGGTVTFIYESYDGITYYDTTLTNGIFYVPRGFFLQVTYSVAPTMVGYLI